MTNSKDKINDNIEKTSAFSELLVQQERKVNFDPDLAKKLIELMNDYTERTFVVCLTYARAFHEHRKASLEYKSSKEKDYESERKTKDLQKNIESN